MEPFTGSGGGGGGGWDHREQRHQHHHYYQPPQQPQPQQEQQQQFLRRQQGAESASAAGARAADNTGAPPATASSALDLLSILAVSELASGASPAPSRPPASLPPPAGPVPVPAIPPPVPPAMAAPGSAVAAESRALASLCLGKQLIAAATAQLAVMNNDTMAASTVPPPALAPPPAAFPPLVAPAAPLMPAATVFTDTAAIVAAAAAPLLPPSIARGVTSPASTAPLAPPPFMQGGSSTAYSSVSSSGASCSSGASGSTGGSSGNGKGRRKRTAREMAFLEQERRQDTIVPRGVGASSAGDDILWPSTTAQVNARGFRFPFTPAHTAAQAFHPTDGSQSGRGSSTEGASNSSSVARRMSMMMIFDPVALAAATAGGAASTVPTEAAEQRQSTPKRGAGSGLFLPVPVSRRFLEEATAQSIARGREGIIHGIYVLAERGSLDRQRALDSLESLKAMTLVAGKDVSVGVAPMVASLLAERPSAFVARGRPSPPIASIFGRFTSDESACYVVSDVAASGHCIVTCNARMSELFMSTTEIQGLLKQTGIASVFVWGHFLAGHGAAELYAAVARCMLDPWVPPQIDVVAACITRTGARVTCLVSVAVRLNERGRSVMVLRLLPLLHRTFGPVGLIPGSREQPPGTAPSGGGGGRGREQGGGAGVESRPRKGASKKQEGGERTQQSGGDGDGGQRRFVPRLGVKMPMPRGPPPPQLQQDNGRRGPGPWAGRWAGVGVGVSGGGGGGGGGRVVACHVQAAECGCGGVAAAGWTLLAVAC